MLRCVFLLVITGHFALFALCFVPAGPSLGNKVHLNLMSVFLSD